MRPNRAHPELTVRVMARLYSPLGLGTGLDLVYDHHNMPVAPPFTSHSVLLACARDVHCCNASHPTRSSAVQPVGFGYIEERLPGTCEVLRVVRRYTVVVSPGPS